MSKRLILPINTKDKVRQLQTKVLFIGLPKKRDNIVIMTNDQIVKTLTEMKLLRK